MSFTSHDHKNCGVQNYWKSIEPCPFNVSFNLTRKHIGVIAAVLLAATVSWADEETIPDSAAPIEPVKAFVTFVGGEQVPKDEFSKVDNLFKGLSLDPAYEEQIIRLYKKPPFSLTRIGWVKELRDTYRAIEEACLGSGNRLYSVDKVHGTEGKYEGDGRFKCIDVNSGKGYAYDIYRTLIGFREGYVIRAFPLDMLEKLEITKLQAQKERVEGQRRKDEEARLARDEQRRLEEALRREREAAAGRFLREAEVRAKVFRKSMKPGDQSHCGLIVEVKKPIVQVQSMIGPVWLKFSQIYPPGDHDCIFDNGIYRN